MLIKTKACAIIALLFLGNLGIAQDTKFSKRTPRVGSKPVEKNGEAWFVAIVQENTETSRGQILQLWDCYYVYQEDEHQCFLGNPTNANTEELEMKQGLGWVSKDCLLISTQAARTDKKIYRKVIVVDNKHDSRVPIFNAPKEGASERGKAPMYAFFYIYKDVQDYYLIGLSSQTWIDDAAHDVLGWIHKRSCCEWHTREAISYSPSTRDIRISQEKKSQNGMVCIYREQRDAEQQNAANIIEREAEKTTWYYNTPRYPLLDSISINQKILFQISFLGGQKSETTPYMIANIREKRQKLAQIDVMFVVDATTNMELRVKMMKAVEDAVAHFTKLAASQKGLAPDLAFGITFYSDFDPRRPYTYQPGKLFEPRVVHIHPMQNNVSQFTRLFENENIWKGAEQPKSLFYAIDSALHQKAKWRDGSQRYIVLIGLTGNHRTEDKNPRDISHLTINDVISLLQKDDVAVYGIQILDENSLESSTVNSFRDQVCQIVKECGRGAYVSVFANPTKTENQKDIDLHNLLPVIFEQFILEFRTLQQALSDFEYGFSPEDSVKRHHKGWQEIWKRFQDNLIIQSITAQKRKWFFLTPQLGVINNRFIKSLNIDIKDLQGEGMVFDKGWVWEFQPNTNMHQIQVWLLIDRLELSRVAYFLSSLHSELKAVSKPEQYLEVWTTLLRTAFGIDTIPTNEPIDHLIKQHSGLPFINGLLSYSLDDFVKSSQSSDFRQEVLEKLNYSCSKLFLVLTEQEVEKVVYADGTTISNKKRRWWQEKGSDVEYAWVESEMFP